jgi:hypothetical protein
MPGSNHIDTRRKAPDFFSNLKLRMDKGRTLRAKPTVPSAPVAPAVPMATSEMVVETVKPRIKDEGDLVAPVALSPHATGLDARLELERQRAYQRPWNKLEKGLKLNRLRLFAEEEAAREHYSPSDQTNLFEFLHTQLERRMITGKQQVQYDQARERITSVRGLRTTIDNDGHRVFLMQEPRRIVRRTARSPHVKMEKTSPKHG